MNSADQVEGRIISGTIQIKLTPPQTDDVGETDAATQFGLTLIRGTLQLMENAAKAEGFEVDASFTITVY